MKDDTGAYAVFTEQSSSASQRTDAKVMDGTIFLKIITVTGLLFSN